MMDGEETLTLLDRFVNMRAGFRQR